MDNKHLDKSKNIEKQVERWDLYAKLAPTFFLVTAFVCLAFGVSFETLFNAGMVWFSLTAVTWWFWTIFSIRYLVTLLRRATENLIEVGDELKEVKREYQELRDDENANR